MCMLLRGGPGWVGRCFGIAGMLLLSFVRSGPAAADGPPPTSEVPKSFLTPEGIRIQVGSDRKDLSPEEIAGALEKWARQLRGRPGPDVLEFVPAPGSTASPPAPAAAPRVPTPAEMALQELVPQETTPPLPPRHARPQVPARTVAIPVPDRLQPSPAGKQAPEVLLGPETGRPLPTPDAPLPASMPTLAQMAADGNGFHIVDQGVSISGYETAPTWVLLPRTLLWTPPLANPLEPRFYVKGTTLQNNNVENPLDTAIGGTLGLVRYHPTGRNDKAWQLDFFAVCFSRWDNQGDGVGVDWRVGVPLTFAQGPWEGKIAYEHTSTHLSDEFAEHTGRKRISNTRDEIVLGLAYRFLDDFRAYGILGFALSRHIPGDDKSPLRFDCGLEWCSPCATGWHGRPFAAVDLEFRGEQDHQANFNSQIGWIWRGYDYGRAFRVALEYYTGRSTYGQFYLDRENWLGVAVLYDF